MLKGVITEVIIATWQLDYILMKTEDELTTRMQKLVDDFDLWYRDPRNRYIMSMFLNTEHMLTDLAERMERHLLLSVGGLSFMDYGRHLIQLAYLSVMWMSRARADINELHDTLLTLVEGIEVVMDSENWKKRREVFSECEKLAYKRKDQGRIQDVAYYAETLFAQAMLRGVTPEEADKQRYG